ncbi:MAG: hypothetical protein AAF718_10675 [Pseudomonadota bacterium]
MRTLLLVVFTSLSFPAFAQSSLGISGLELSLGMVEDEDGEHRGAVRSALTVDVTEFHGFQGDVAFTDTDTGTIGTVAAHFYMTPKQGQKYGLFGAISDVDGRSMFYGSLGAEGMISLGLDTNVEGRAGMGWADTDGLDFIFAGAALAHQLTPSLELEFALDVADFDEAGFSATTYDAGLTATYSADGKPWGAFVSVTQSGVSGHGDATRIGAGITITLGTSGGTDPHSRPFRTPDPAGSLVRRNLW